MPRPNLPIALVSLALLLMPKERRASTSLFLNSPSLKHQSPEPFNSGLDASGKTGMVPEDQSASLGVVGVLNQLLQDREAALVTIPKVIRNEVDVIGRVSPHHTTHSSGASDQSRHIERRRHRHFVRPAGMPYSPQQIEPSPRLRVVIRVHSDFAAKSPVPCEDAHVRSPMLFNLHVELPEHGAPGNRAPFFKCPRGGGSL